MPVYVPGDSYLRRLMERRKVVDLLPWMELYQGGQLGCLPPASPAGSQVNLSIKRPYAIDLQDLTIAGAQEQNGGGILAYGPVSTMLMPTIGALGTNQSVSQFADISLVGSANNGWWGLGAGAFYAPNEIVRMQANLVAALGAAGVGAQGLQLHLAGRGYREWPKGSLNPAQLTRAEYAQLGFAFDPYTYGGRVTVPAATPSGQETSLQFTFDRDFLADDFTLNVFEGGVASDTWPFTPGPDPIGLALIRFDTDRIFFSEPVSRWVAVGEPQPRTAWKFPIPLTLNAGTTINFRVVLPVAVGAVCDFDFVLHGHLLRKL
ncbi:MAG: hypothetical protein WC969_15235 [Elusimicrobiota bacterium]